MDSNEILGQRLQSFRKAKDVTQAEMAEATGHTPHYISALENGVNKMSVPTLIAYSKKLNVSIDELLGLKNPKIIPELKAILSDMDEVEQRKIYEMIQVIRK